MKGKTRNTYNLHSSKTDQVVRVVHESSQRHKVHNENINFSISSKNLQRQEKLHSTEEIFRSKFNLVLKQIYWKLF